MIKPYFETENGRLYHGDCLKIMPELTQRFDMILSDPPYGTTACEWDSIVPLGPLWKQLKRLIKTNGAIVMTASQPFTTILISSNMKMFKYEWIWNKINGANFMNIKNRPLKTQEQVIIFSKTTGFTFNPTRVQRSDKSLKRDPMGSRGGRGKEGSVQEIQHYGFKGFTNNILNADGMKHPIDIITFGVFEKGRYQFKHPTKKPIALMEYLIKTYTNDSEIVLDFAAGSGTTGVACERLNRKHIMIEKEEKYCEISAKRIKQETQQLKLFT